VSAELRCALRAVISESESASTSAPGTSFHGQHGQALELQLASAPGSPAIGCPRRVAPCQASTVQARTIHRYIVMASVDGEAAEREEVGISHALFAVFALSFADDCCFVAPQVSALVLDRSVCRRCSPRRRPQCNTTVHWRSD
jgi:hypothetical protein